MIIEHISELLHELRCLDNVEVYIWGSGAYGNLIGELLNKEDIDWVAYYDNYCFENSSLQNGKEILCGGGVKHKEAKYIISMRDYTAVKKQLLDEYVPDNNIICFSNRFFSEIQNRNGYSKIHEQQISKLHNIYKMKRCFIVGNGPSLRTEDLNMISRNNDYSFGCNEIYRAYNHFEWRPDFYFMSDVNGIREILRQVDIDKIIPKDGARLFLRSDADLINKYKLERNIYFFNQIYSPIETMSFSSECEKKVYIGYTVTFIMIQMAAYMGFNKIILLGIDHNYSQEMVDDVMVESNIQDHTNMMGTLTTGCYEKTKVDGAYLCAKEYAKKNNIKIYNATRGGKLETFERVNFDSLF